MFIYSAILTRATSSGLDAWNSFYPISLIIGVTLWQTAKAVIRSLNTHSGCLLIAIFLIMPLLSGFFY